MLPHLARFAAILGHPRARHMLVACGLVVGLMLALGTAWLCVEARRADIADTMRELNNLSLVLAEQTDRAFEALDQAQLGMIEHLRELGIDTPEKFDHQLASAVIQQELRRRIAGLPQINVLALDSRDGHMVSRSSDWPVPPVEVGDRDYFQALLRDSGRGTFISTPVRSRSDGGWTIVFARAFTGPDDGLIGIVTAGLHVDVFESLFARIAVPAEASFSLFRQDGILLAHYPHSGDMLGRNFGDTERFRHLQASVDHAGIEHTGLIDSKARLVATHGVTHYPLILVATNTLEATLAPWRERTSWLAVVVTGAELVLLGVVLLGVRQLRAQERLIAADASALRAEAARKVAESELVLARQREVSQHEAHVQSQRFDVALGNMLQGLLMFDGGKRLLVINRRFTELFGLPADTADLVASYGELMDLVVGCGNVTPEDMSAAHQWRSSMFSHPTRATFTWELSDGRAMTLTHQPMADGWLATYEDITESRIAGSRLAYMARHDALTDLPNRVMFRAKLEDALSVARHDAPVALLCLDLDQFKAVNDTLGHSIGDALLQAVAIRLTERTRDSDTVARLGGDEFAVVQTPIDRPSDAALLAERLLAMFEEPFDVQGQPIVIGTSIGIAFAPHDGVDPDELLKCADLALYRAKAEGRGIYRLFQAEMDAQMRIRRLLEIDLRNALRSDQMELFYQPLIDVCTGSAAGFEALLRWRHPNRGLVPPHHFIPLAEEIGAIVPIGEWVLRRACFSAVLWPGELKVAVNLSPVQFKSRNLVAAVAGALEESGLSPNRLELEITETVMLHDTAATLATLHDLHALGVSIAMDDFGTGYSSLSYLHKFPFNRIKIDQSFVRELGKQRDSIAIVRAVTALSRELGMVTTAEGVETSEQLRMLVLAGCTNVQGYLFSPPVPEPAIAALLQTLPTVADLLPSGTMTAGDRPAMVDTLQPAL